MVYYLSSRRPENNGYAIEPMTLENLKATNIDTKIAGEVPALTVLIVIPIVVFLVVYLLLFMVKPSFCCLEETKTMADGKAMTSMTLSKTKALMTSTVVGLVALGGTYAYIKKL